MATVYAICLSECFVDNQLEPAGKILVGYAGPFGEYLKPCDESGALLESDPSGRQTADPIPAARQHPAPAAPKPLAQDAPVARYVAQHAGGGSYNVVDSVTGMVVSRTWRLDPKNRTRAKASAEAEAKRLNQGGLPRSSDEQQHGTQEEGTQEPDNPDLHLSEQNT